MNVLPLTYIIPFGKYKGQQLSNLINDDSYRNWVINNCRHDTQLLESVKHYNNEKLTCKKQIPITGINLTQRIDCVLANRHFSDICDYSSLHPHFTVKSNIFPLELCECIQKMRDIYPSGAGVFIDYLCRRILSEFIKKTFTDGRTEYTISLNNELLEEGKESILNEHIPITLKDAYNKTADLSNKTCDIIIDIYVTSLAHNVCFGNYDTNREVLLFEFVKTHFSKSYINDLLHFFSSFNGKEFLLNPSIGGRGIDKSKNCGIVGADCDLVIDDKLFDFKVVKYGDDKRDMIQLYGYTSLLAQFNYKINEISTINFYKNEIKTWDVSSWDKYSDFLKYLDMDFYRDRTGLTVLNV